MRRLTRMVNGARDVVVEAGLERLLLHGIDALRSHLNASVLAGLAPLSRDSAYRAFRNDPGHRTVSDAIVAAVSRLANDPAWAGSRDALRDTLTAYQATPHGDGDRSAVEAAVIAGLQANFEAQFHSPGVPVGWLLQAAALSSSPAWRGKAPDDEDVALGRELLEHRRALYREVTGQFASILTMVMSEVGRRPRCGIEPETVVMLLHALQDGAVLRNMIEPGAFPSDLVAEAMYRLAEAFTEDGALADPRRPDDQRGGEAFDGLLRAAESLWCAQPEITVEEAADRAGVTHEAAGHLFPTVGDLADSLLRAHVVGGGFADLGRLPEGIEANQRLVGLVAELRSLCDLADRRPHAVAAAKVRAPARSAPFLEDLVQSGSRVVGALGIVTDPARSVRDLVTFASEGRAGWPTVTALLRALGYDVA